MNESNRSRTDDAHPTFLFKYGLCFVTPLFRLRNNEGQDERRHYDKVRYGIRS